MDFLELDFLLLQGPFNDSQQVVSLKFWFQICRKFQALLLLDLRTPTQIYWPFSLFATKYVDTNNTQLL